MNIYPLDLPIIFHGEALESLAGPEEDGLVGAQHHSSIWIIHGPNDDLLEIREVSIFSPKTAIHEIFICVRALKKS